MLRSDLVPRVRRGVNFWRYVCASPLCRVDSLQPKLSPSSSRSWNLILRRAVPDLASRTQIPDERACSRWSQSRSSARVAKATTGNASWMIAVDDSWLKELLSWANCRFMRLTLSETTGTVRGKAAATDLVPNLQTVERTDAVSQGNLLRAVLVVETALR